MQAPLACFENMKFLLELSFVGSNYHGWQVQQNAPSVQKTFQAACEKQIGPCKITGCSRTDAGVHARRFYCTVENDLLASIPPDSFPLAIAHRLPPDLSVKSARIVPDDFHPRYDAKAKEYEYLICTAFPSDPFFQGRSWMLLKKDTDGEELARRMNEGAQMLVGYHDFSSFCAAGGKVEDKRRTVYYCRVKKQGQMVVLRICADGFLYNMVRIITGTLYDYACGRITDLSSVLEARDRDAAGRTAPAEGLYLNRVFYREKERLEAQEEDFQ